jgi:hypothetical protein
MNIRERSFRLSSDSFARFHKSALLAFIVEKFPPISVLPASGRLVGFAALDGAGGLSVF